MSPDRKIYLLDPQKLKPETIAVAFAKTSRSPLPFSEIAAELTDEKSAEFHEKWVVGYGHASVAEHAVLHIAIENVSRLAIETIESNRLASYTEKSTRYQKWSANQFITPPELDGHPLLLPYQETCRLLFQTYQQALPVLQSYVAQKNPRQPQESEAAWERRTRSEYVDVCRFLLPAASVANVGVTINARALEHALRKMHSHPLAEVQAIGAEVQAVSQVEVPTLIKYVEPVAYLARARRELGEATHRLPAASAGEPDWCQLVHCDPEGENRLLAAALYRFGDIDYTQAIAGVEGLPPEEKRRLAQALIGNLERFDIPLRELEHITFSFDLLLDQGAFFELKRHRMLTLTPQGLTGRLGYAMPQAIVAAGFESPYRQAMEAAQRTYERLFEFDPEVASYMVPNAFNRRALITLNLRSAYHLIGLRAAENAHFSIRRVAYRMAERLQERLPLLAASLRLPPGETWQQIEARYFAQTG